MKTFNFFNKVKNIKFENWELLYLFTCPELLYYNIYT